MRFQLAPIKKLEGSLQIHFLLSSFHPTRTFPGGAGGGEAGSIPLRRTWAGILMPNDFVAQEGGAGEAQSGLGGSGSRLPSRPWEGRIRRLAAGAARVLMKTSPGSWQGAPDAAPRPLSATWERMSAARGLPTCLDVRAQRQRFLPGPAPVSLGLDRQYHLSAHTPFARRQPGLLNFLWPHLAWRKSRGQSRSSHLARPGAQPFRNGLTHGALNYGDYTAIRGAVLL